MSIWKCAMGGYHSGMSCQEEFKSWNARFTTAVGNNLSDIQLVRLPTRHEVYAELSQESGLTPDMVDKVLSVLVELTPDGKDKAAWNTLHGR